MEQFYCWYCQPNTNTHTNRNTNKRSSHH